jgi:hypothetical protein
MKSGSLLYEPYRQVIRRIDSSFVGMVGWNLLERSFHPVSLLPLFSSLHVSPSSRTPHLTPPLTANQNHAIVPLKKTLRIIHVEVKVPYPNFSCNNNHDTPHRPPRRTPRLHRRRLHSLTPTLILLRRTLRVPHHSSYTTFLIT